MKKVFIVLGLCFFLSMILVVGAMAQLPKEGLISSVSAYSGTFKMLAMGQERVQITYETLGVIMSDTGEGIFHNAAFRCIGAMHVVKGAFDDDSGFCVATRPDGDQAFQTYKAAGRLGTPVKGTAVWVGGTGKLTGIQGTSEFTRFNTLKPAAEGTFQGYNRMKSSYKLP
jgi:hypothetical protein